MASLASRRAQGPGSIYVGQLLLSTRIKDVETMFEGYGPIRRCDIKYGCRMAYAFIDFEVKEDAADCIKFENGRKINGLNIIVEWTKEGREEMMARRADPASQSKDQCFKCRRIGHWARDCPELGKRRHRSPPSPRPRSRSRSCDRCHRSRSRSHDRCRCSKSNDKQRSRSRFGDRNRSRSGSRRSRSSSNGRKASLLQDQSIDNKKHGSASKPRSRSKSPRRSRSGSKTKSRFRSPNQKLENHSKREANDKSPQDNRRCHDDNHREDYGDQDATAGLEVPAKITINTMNTRKQDKDEEAAAE